MVQLFRGLTAFVIKAFIVKVSSHVRLKCLSIALLFHFEFEIWWEDELLPVLYLDSGESISTFRQDRFLFF
jgi:hypothetical protein